MPEVVELLRTLPRSVTPAPAGTDDAAADLARGHRALARRRRQRLAGLAGGVAVVAGVAVAVTLPGQPGRSAAPATASTAAGAHPAIQLVAYTGAQPAGFTVGTVPAGWQVVSSNAFTFVVAPPGSSNAPAADGTGGSFVGRIVVMLQGDSTLAPGATVTAVTVNGQPGKMAASDDSDPRFRADELFFPDASGHQIQVQVPLSLGLSTSQIVSFAAGVTVTSAAQTGSG